MSRGFNAVVVWTQVPVANRTVEVNTKTGFSLTAGSYVVRASDVQRGTFTIGNAQASNTATITSVTTTRAVVVPGGFSNDETTAQVPDENETRVVLTNATTVTGTRALASASTITVPYQIQELY